MCLIKLNRCENLINNFKGWSLIDWYLMFDELEKFKIRFGHFVIKEDISYKKSSLFNPYYVVIKHKYVS